MPINKTKTNMKEVPLAFIDMEMTGLDPERHEITEIGLVLASQPDFTILDEWEVKVQPKHIETADPEALELNGYDPAVWKAEAVSLEEALTTFIEKTEGAVMVAQNVSGDVMFLQKALHQTGLEERMDYHRMDSLSLAFGLLYANPDVQRFSLRNLAKHLDIENKNAHTALSDARTTFEIVRKLLLG